MCSLVYASLRIFSRYDIIMQDSVVLCNRCYVIYAVSYAVSCAVSYAVSYSVIGSVSYSVIRLSVILS